MDILKQLEEGKPFSGRNGAFTGRVEPQHVIWAFERGDYYFL